MMMKKFFFVLSLLFCFEAQSATNEELRIGIAQEFETLNPTTHQMVASGYIGYATYRTLTSMTPQGQWQCWLCVEMPTIENGKAKIIDESGKKKIIAEWEIKPGAKWADGTPVTAKDVILGWEVGASPNVSVGEKDIYTRIEAITPDPANPKKFTMKYNKAEYDFNYLGTFYLLPDHIERPVWEKTKDQPGEYERKSKFTTEPTTPGLYNGPYRVAELVLGSHVILLPNPHFYGEAPKIKKIVFKLIPDTATLEANLLSGTIDMICELGFKLDQALALEKRIQSDPGLQAKHKVLYKDATVWEHIDLQLKNPVLKDLRVRQALLYAVDRDKLVQALFQGRQKKAMHSVSPIDPYYTAEVTDYPYDPKKAEALLEEAGWKKGTDGYRYKDGQKLSLLFQTTAQDKTREKVQVYLQSEWKKAGIEAVIKNEPARVFFAETAQKAKFTGMTMYAFVTSPDNPPRSLFHSAQIPTEANGYNGQNRPGWVNAKADQLLEAVYVEFDPAKRKELMKHFLQEYTRELPYLPLYYRVDIAVVPANMTGFEIAGHQFYSTLAVEKWNLQ